MDGDEADAYMDQCEADIAELQEEREQLRASIAAGGGTMTKQEAREFIERERDPLAYANQLAGKRVIDFALAIADYLLADDEPAETDPYDWVRKLPNNTPVEALIAGGVYTLWYTDGPYLVENRDCDGGEALELEHFTDIRWPLPPDEWAGAHRAGRTHIVLARNGGVFTTGDPEDYRIGDEFAAVVPIPEATE